MLRKIFIHSLFALVGLAMLACSQRYEHAFYHNFEQRRWSAADTLSFAVDSLPRSLCLVPVFCLRSAAAPRPDFAEIYVEIRQQWQLPSASKRRVATISRCDTLCVPLVLRSGDGTTRGLSLRSHSSKLPLVELPRFAHGRIRLRHIMRRQLMSGIADVSLRFEESEISSPAVSLGAN